MYTINDLKNVVKALRDPDSGCPWDIKQTIFSITDSSIEEIYELVDAIENENWPQIKEELGDVLFQIIFYSQIADESERFSLNDVIHVLTEKLIRRHPHVFPTGDIDNPNKTLLTEEEVKTQWEKIKQEERQTKSLKGLFDDIPKALPAILRAQKLQKRMHKIGFDWSNPLPVFDKLNEEVAELQQAIDKNNTQGCVEEMGDILFTCVNLARQIGLDAEMVLRKANHKVEQRFAFIEAKLDNTGSNFEDASQDDLEALWNLSKSIQKK